MPVAIPSISVHVCYRPDGTKAAAMKEGTASDFYTRFLKRDLAYLMLPPAETAPMRIDGDGRILCKWHAGVAYGDDEDDALDAIEKQVVFLNTEKAAELLAYMEIERIELVSLPVPAGVIVLPEEIIEQAYAREAELLAESAALQERYSAVQEEGRRLMQENDRLRSLRAAQR